jgi:hypothetical protein
VSKPKRRKDPKLPKLTKSGRIDLRTAGNSLTPKHRRLIRAYVDPNSPTEGNATQSAIAAGFSPVSAPQTGNRIIKSDNGERELTRIYDAAGLTVEKLAKRVKQGMNAKETKAFIHQKTGDIVYSKPLVAHDVRLRAVRLAHELRGDFAAKRVELDVRVAVLAGRIQAARRREVDQLPQDVVDRASDKQPEPITPSE